MATALYTVGGPVKMDALFEAYVAAAGSGTRHPGPAYAAGDPEHDQAAGLSSALEALADLGVVELGTDEAAGGLTVTLVPARRVGCSPAAAGPGLARAGARRRCPRRRCRCWSPWPAVTSRTARRRSPPGWPRARARRRTGADRCGGPGSPGLRGAGFAVLDRIGAEAVPAVRAALDDPVLHAHAAGLAARARRGGRPGPGRPGVAAGGSGSRAARGGRPQGRGRGAASRRAADRTGGTGGRALGGQPSGVTGLLTALSDHHPDPAVARAARKARVQGPLVCDRPRRPRLAQGRQTTQTS